MSNLQKTNTQPDEWVALKAFTDARIALGSTGVSLPLKAALELRAAHAQAKDAVYSALDEAALRQALELMGLAVCQVKSKANNRDEYLQRPDYGRALHEESGLYLKTLPTASADIAIIIADGLSAAAVNLNAIPFIRAFIAKLNGFTLGPIVLATQARVAIADEVGALLKAKLTIILIGERPGLSAADSMGAYITYGPQRGNTDERRNCVSNVRAGGLPPQLAAEKVLQLVSGAFYMKQTGVLLKDTGTTLLPLP
jgi:ethanolamine ammonia-lyase small subunit